MSLHHRTQCRRISQPNRERLLKLLDAFRFDVHQFVISTIETCPRWPERSKWEVFEDFKAGLSRMAGSDARPGLQHRRVCELAMEVFTEELKLIPRHMPRLTGELAKVGAA